MKTYKQNGWDVPEGWAIVPVEPTPAMLGAGLRHVEGMASMPSAYGAMLTVAPQPPAKPEVSAEPVSQKRLDIARRNIRAFLNKPDRFEYEIDRQAALNCVDVLESAIAAQPDAQAIRDEVLSELRGQVMEMQDSLETVGPYSQEAAGVALDGVLDAIDDIMKGGAA